MECVGRFTLPRPRRHSRFLFPTTRCLSNKRSPRLREVLPLSEERFARLVAKEADRGGGLGGAASWSLAAGLGFRDCISSDFPLVVGDRAAPQPREHRGHAHGGPIQTFMSIFFIFFTMAARSPHPSLLRAPRARVRARIPAARVCLSCPRRSLSCSVEARPAARRHAENGGKGRGDASHSQTRRPSVRDMRARGSPAKNTYPDAPGSGSGRTWAPPRPGLRACLAAARERRRRSGKSSEIERNRETSPFFTTRSLGPVLLDFALLTNPSPGRQRTRRARTRTPRPADDATRRRP